MIKKEADEEERADQGVADLRATLEHKVQQCKTLEARVAYKTRIIAQQEEYIARLEREQDERAALLESGQQAWLTERAALRAQLEDLLRHSFPPGERGCGEKRAREHRDCVF